MHKELLNNKLESFLLKKTIFTIEDMKADVIFYVIIFKILREDIK